VLIFSMAGSLRSVASTNQTVVSCAPEDVMGRASSRPNPGRSLQAVMLCLTLAWLLVASTLQAEAEESTLKPFTTSSPLGAEPPEDFQAPASSNGDANVSVPPQERTKPSVKDSEPEVLEGSKNDFPDFTTSSHRGIR
jgi:hypothetical protein